MVKSSEKKKSKDKGSDEKKGGFFSRLKQRLKNPEKHESGAAPSSREEGEFVFVDDRGSREKVVSVVDEAKVVRKGSKSIEKKEAKKKEKAVVGERTRGVNVKLVSCTCM